MNRKDVKAFPHHHLKGQWLTRNECARLTNPYYEGVFSVMGLVQQDVVRQQGRRDLRGGRLQHHNVALRQ